MWEKEIDKSNGQRKADILIQLERVRGRRGGN